MKRLGIDLDGVCCDFSSKFVQLGNQRYGTNHTVLDQRDWDFRPWFTSQQVDEIWAKDIRPCKNFWLTLRPLEGTGALQHVPSGDRPGTLSNFRSAELFFITSRVETAGMTAREQSCWWLRNHFGITYPTVIVVEHSGNKVAIARALELEAFVDDKVSTVKQMHEA